MKCPNCESENTNSIIVHPKILYYLCANCGIYFQAKHDPEEIRQYYESGNYRSMHKQDDERIFQTKRAKNIIQYIEPPVTVHIDIGCSMGILLDTIKEKFDCESYGVDLDPVLVNRPVYLDVKDVPEQADLVTMIHSLEHMPSPLSVLHDVYAKLKPGGRLLVEVPNGDTRDSFGRWYRGAFSVPHVVAFSSDALGWTMDKAGFQNIHYAIHGDGGVIGAASYYYLLMIGEKCPA